MQDTLTHYPMRDGSHLYSAHHYSDNARKSAYEQCKLLEYWWKHCISTKGEYGGVWMKAREETRPVEYDVYVRITNMKNVAKFTATFAHTN
ncbi:hypothetical protein BG58_10910 [Caballeronia jiangsuensis]|nr:hypothetical protein BG58_10910 [Caballeronia jiangsuensis]